MIKHLITQIGGVENVGVISICLFFAAFGGMVIYALCLKKPFLKDMEQFPLRDGDDRGNMKGENQHE